MASFAEMMGASALEGSDPNKVNDTSASFAAGAQIAHQAQQLQLEKQKHAVELQQLQATKMEKFAQAVEKGQQYSGKAQSNYYNKFLPQYKNALGLQNTISDEAIQFNGADEGMIRRQGHLVSLVNQGKLDMATAIATYHDPQKMVEMFPGDANVMQSAPFDQKFSDELNKAEQHRQQNNAQMAKAGSYTANTAIRSDDQAATAAKRINNDELMSPILTQSNNVQKGAKLLVKTAAGENPSWKTGHETLQDFSAALNPKGGGSDFKLKQFEFQGGDQIIANILEKISNNPDQPMPDSVVTWLKNMGNNLNGTFKTQISARAKQLTKEADTVYKSNPHAAEAAKGAAQSYIDGTWNGGPKEYEIGRHRMTADQVKAMVEANPKVRSQLPAAIRKELGL